MTAFLLRLWLAALLLAIGQAHARADAGQLEAAVLFCQAGHHGQAPQHHQIQDAAVLQAAPHCAAIVAVLAAPIGLPLLSAYTVRPAASLQARAPPGRVPSVFYARGPPRLA